jgi:hypothetical protein
LGGFFIANPVLKPFLLYRLRLRYADEPAVSSAALKRKEGGGQQQQQNLATRQQQKLETIYILEPHELDNQRLSLVADKVSRWGLDQRWKSQRIKIHRLAYRFSIDFSIHTLA